MRVISEKRIKEEIADFIENAIDNDLAIFYGRFAIDFTEEEFNDLEDEDKEFVRLDLQNIIDESFDSEMTVAIKFYQIMNCLSYCGVTNHRPPRFKFEEMSTEACHLFLISEGIIDE
jgi:hypothetical protein